RQIVEDLDAGEIDPPIQIEEVEALARLEFDAPQLRLIRVVEGGGEQRRAPPTEVEWIPDHDARDRIVDELVESAERNEIAEVADVLRAQVVALDVGELELRISHRPVVGPRLDG